MKFFALCQHLFFQLSNLYKIWTNIKDFRSFFTTNHIRNMFPNLENQKMIVYQTFMRLRDQNDLTFDKNLITLNLNNQNVQAIFDFYINLLVLSKINNEIYTENCELTEENNIYSKNIDIDREFYYIFQLIIQRGIATVVVFENHADNKFIAAYFIQRSNECNKANTIIITHYIKFVGIYDKFLSDIAKKINSLSNKLISKQKSDTCSESSNLNFLNRNFYCYLSFYINIYESFHQKYYELIFSREFICLRFSVFNNLLKKLLDNKNTQGKANLNDLFKHFDHECDETHKIAINEFKSICIFELGIDYFSRVESFSKILVQYVVRNNEICDILIKEGLIDK